MKMASSRFFIPLIRFRPLVCLSILFLLSMQVALADIGETYALKQERTSLLAEIELLQQPADSLRGPEVTARIAEMKARVIELDERIFRSYDETVARMASQKVAKERNDQFAVYLAMATTALALFLTLLLLMARVRVMNNGQAGLSALYRQLAMDLLSRVSVEQAARQRMLRVNVVVVIGLVLMSASVLAYLVSSL